MNKSSGSQIQLSIEEVEDSAQYGSNSFYDPTNPLFAPPKAHDTKKVKTWKRKIIVFVLILILIAGGVVSLYLLLRVKRVNVRVQAEGRRESPKTQPNSNNSENGLSAEAINIARQAIGADTAKGAEATSPSATVTPLPFPSPSIPQSLSFTGNSPAFPPSYEQGSISGGSKETVGVQPLVREVAEPTLVSKANSIETLFVEDWPPNAPASRQPPSLNQIRVDKKARSTETLKKPLSAVLPPFGTLLPVRTQGVIFSVRNNSFARLELTRDCTGEGWSMPKGTLLIGRVSGSEYDRAFINIQGYIDPRTNRFVKMVGEVLGSDGGTGLQGKRMVFDRSRLKQTLSKVASGGLQVAGMMAGALTGRGTLVLSGPGYGALNPITDEVGNGVKRDGSRAFVKIEAGQPAYVMIADLPKEIQGVDAPGTEEHIESATSLNDGEVMELILFGAPDDLRAALPLMNDEQKRLVLKSARLENER